MAERGFGVRLSANVDAYVAAMAKATGATEAFSATSVANMKKLGADMQRVGGQLTRNVSLPLVAAGVGALKLSGDFDAAFARMVGLAGVAANEVDGLKESVLALAGKTGRSPLELADALYFASSAGLDTAHAMDAVTAGAEAAAAGMGKTQDVVGLVASAMANYGAANMSAARATDILTSTIKVGRADPNELAMSLGSILPIAAQLGISFEQVGGATAFLSNIMGDTSMTVTALRGVLNTLIQPSAQGKQALLDMGTSAGELQSSIDQNGLMGALDLLRSKGFAGNQEALTNLFPDVRALEGALALLNDTSGTLAGNIDAVTNSTGSTDRAFAAMADTGAFKMKQAWADIQVGLIKAGEIIMPIVADVAGAVGHLAEVFAGLPKPVQTIIVAFLGLLAAAGPVVVIAGTIVKNFMLVQGALTTVGAGGVRSLNGLGTAAKGVGVAFGVLAAATIALDVLDQVTGRTGDTTDAMNHLVVAINGVSKAKGAESALAMASALGDMANAIDSKRSNWSSWQHDLLGAFDHGKLGALNMKEAFDGLLKTSPQQALQMVDALQQVADSAYLGDAAAKAFMADWGLSEGTIDGFRKKAGETVGALKVLAGATTEVTDVTDAFWFTAKDVAAAQKALADATARTADQEKAMKATIDAATTALNDQVSALEDDLKAQMALVDFARGAADAQYALADATDAYSKFLEDMPGKLADIAKSKDTEAEKSRQVNALYREGAKAAQQMADDTVAAYQQASNGTLTHTAAVDIGNESMLRQAATASGPVRQAILDHIALENKIPTNIATYIAALVDQGKIGDAAALLAGVSEPRTAAILADADQVSIDVADGKLATLKDKPRTATIGVLANTSAADLALAAAQQRWVSTFKVSPVSIPAGSGTKVKGTASGTTVPETAGGRFVDRPMISTLGEGGNPEVVLPLTNAARMRELMSDTRVWGPIMAALGGVGSAAGRTVNLTHTSIPAAISTPTVAGDATAPVTVSNGDSVMAAKFERGDIAAAQYDAYLAEQQATTERYSDREMQIWRIREGLKRDQLKATDDTAKAAQDLADANQVREDDRMKYLFDTQQISLADYQAYLAGRQASYEVYSKEWIAVTQQMASLREADAASAVKSAEDIVRAAFDTMRVQQDLTDAIREQADSYSELQQAETANYLTSIDQNKSDQEKASANSAFISARARAAAAVIRGVDAQANAQGFADGTPEWARYVREQIAAFIPDHADLADELNAYLATVPALGDGGYVPATRGGRIVRLAEAGQGEFAVPANKMMMAMSSMGSSGGSTFIDNRQFHINGTVLDRPGVARELREILAEDDRRNGRSLARS